MRGSMRNSKGSGLYAVFDELGDGHRTDSAGHRRDPSGDLPDGLEVDITDELAVAAAIHADIDYAGARFDHVRGDEFRAPDRSDQDVGLSGFHFNILRLRMAYGDRRILLQEQQGERLADVVGAADHHCAPPGELDAG